MTGAGKWKSCPRYLLCGSLLATVETPKYWLLPLELKSLSDDSQLAKRLPTLHYYLKYSSFRILLCVPQACCSHRKCLQQYNCSSEEGRGLPSCQEFDFLAGVSSYREDDCVLHRCPYKVCATASTLYIINILL